MLLLCCCYCFIHLTDFPNLIKMDSPIAIILYARLSFHPKDNVFLYQVVNLWDLRDYNCKLTVPTYEMVEAVCVIPSGGAFDSFLSSYNQPTVKKKRRSPEIYFITVGERGIVRMWNADR